MWYYKNIEITDVIYQEYVTQGYIGFVYEITNLLTDKKYIGKKLWVTRKKLPPLKNKKNKRTKIIPTNWLNYYGSSDEFNDLVKKYGQSNFKREILFLCKSKGEMNYVECYYQMVNHVLLNQDKYYNKFVGVKIHQNHVKTLEPFC